MAIPPYEWVDGWFFLPKYNGKQVATPFDINGWIGNHSLPFTWAGKLHSLSKEMNRFVANTPQTKG